MTEVIIKDGRSGIYAIRNKKNGKCYVGSAVNFGKRWGLHKRELRAGTHHSMKLLNAWLKHGEGMFVFEILEVVEDKALLLEREQFWIEKFCAVKAGYNMSPTAGSLLGFEHRQETREKMSATHTGRKHGPMSQEQKDYYSKLYAGRKLSEETRKRMAEARTGRKFSEETRKKLSESLTGLKKSEEHRRNIADAIRGKPWTEAQREGRRRTAERKRAEREAKQQEEQLKAA